MSSILTVPSGVSVTRTRPLVPIAVAPKSEVDAEAVELARADLHSLAMGIERDQLAGMYADRLDDSQRWVRAGAEVEGIAQGPLGPAEAHSATTLVPIAAATGRALISASSSSARGSESATIPPPTPSHRCPPASSSVRIATFSSSPASGLA